MTEPSSRLVGILLLYYPPYATEAIQRFVAILNAISADNVLVIVKNQNFDLPVPIAHTGSVHLIDGDNSLREFSGWQAGLDYCRQHAILRKDAVLVLANDTFCHHNKFGPITQLAFVWSFKRLFRKPDQLAMSGEMFGSAATFNIAGLTYSHWVSSYLFAITAPLVDKLGRLTPPFDLNLCFTQQAEPDRFMTGPLSLNLTRHIAAWLFGQGSSAKWKESQALSPLNQPQFIGKAKSILCEMYLSANVESVGGKLVCVFDSNFVRQLRRLERLLPKYRQAGKPV